MAIRISQTTIDAHDASALGAWWKEVLAYQDDPSDPNSPRDELYLIEDPTTRHQLLFITVPDEVLPSKRIHFDLTPVDATRDEEVDRLLGMGATMVDDLREEHGWAVLADPEGNVFCVLRSAAERAAAAAAAEPTA